MGTLQNISAIAKRAIEDTEKATESDWSAILSGGLEDIIALCEKERAVFYPVVWPSPEYHFGQVVTARYGGGESRCLIVGMRFGTFPNSKFVREVIGGYWMQEWRYQVVEIVDGHPSQHCDGRWHTEEALSEESEQ